MELHIEGVNCHFSFAVLVAIILVFRGPVVNGQCSLNAVKVESVSVLTDSRYMWWTQTDSGPQEVVQVFSDSNTCQRYVRFGSSISSPSGYPLKSDPCETCVNSIPLSSNRGVRYVGERPSFSDPSKKLIYCNELYRSDLGNVVIQREELKEENFPGSVSPSQCSIEHGAGRWLIRNTPGDLSLTQTARCPFTTGSYRMQYGYNGNMRCLGGTNQIATLRVDGSSMTLDASACEDYVTDRLGFGYSTTDATKDYRLPLNTHLACATGSEFPGTIMGRRLNDAGNLLLLADLDPPANIFLRRPWYYACNYVIVGEEILMSCSTDQSATGILIDPAQTPSRELNIESSVLYFVLVRQKLDPGCEFPTQYERDWFYRYNSNAEIVYEKILNSVDTRYIFRGQNDKPVLNEDTCTLQTSGSINSGTYNYYVFGELEGQLTCYAYLASTSTIQDKVLVRYETTRGIFSFATETVCRDYMTSYNANTDFNKRIYLRVLPRIYLDNYKNGINGANALFGDWTSYSCPFTQEGAFHLEYSQSAGIANQCANDKDSFAVINGNGMQFRACGNKNDNTYQKPYNAVFTCIANWDATVTGHLPPGQGKADEFTSDHYLVLGMRDLSAGPRVMRFYCARYREVSDKIYLALNVDSDTDILCRTDVNSEAYMSSSEGNIRQFTLTKITDICQATPCLNDGTCEASGTLGKFTCKCHGSYKGDLCQFRQETFTETDVTRTIILLVIVFVVLVLIIILALLLKERSARKSEKRRMDSEYGRMETMGAHKIDNISTISADPKSNISLNGSQVQAWFPDYRQNEK